MIWDTHATRYPCDRPREWEARFPPLDPPWTHWQLDGQGRYLGCFPADQLGAALRRVKEYRAHCDQIHAQVAQTMADGSIQLHPSRCLILDRAEEDALDGIAISSREADSRSDTDRPRWIRALRWLIDSPYAHLSESETPRPRIDPPVPDGNMSPQTHYGLDGLLLIVVGFLAIVALVSILPWLADQAPAVRLAAAALPILAIWLIWWLRPRLMRRVWRARCPSCGKTMALRQAAWPVLKDHWMGEPDFEQGVYYPEYVCLACDTTVPMSILRRWFGYYHQLVYFTIGMLLAGLVVGWVALRIIHGGI